MKSLNEQFRDWVAQQDPNQSYVYFAIFDCPIAKFCDEIGLDWQNLGAGGKARIGLERTFGEELIARRRTYGALAERLAPPVPRPKGMVRRIIERVFA